MPRLQPYWANRCSVVNTIADDGNLSESGVVCVMRPAASGDAESIEGSAPGWCWDVTGTEGPNDMMRRFLLVLTMLMGVVFATAPLASAQTDVDIEQVSETVLSADTDALLTGLETPMDDEALPEGFSEAAFAAPGDATAEEGVLPTEDLEGTLGTIAYTVSYDPSASGSPEAETDDSASTPALDDLSGLSFGFASLNYIVFEDELTSDDLEDFKSGAEEGIASEDEGTATVEDITVGDTDAVLLTYVIEEEGVQSVVQMVAVPVGNVMVMSMTVLAAETVDADQLRVASEDLALAGIDHLGVVAEDAQ